MLRDHEHIAEPRERGPVGHDAREGHLRCATIGIAGER